jgi:hypothetical protein
VGSSTRPRIRHGDGNVVQLRIELEEVHLRVWRRLLVSARASLLELHGVIQRTLGRDGFEAHAFEYDGIRYLDPDAGIENAPATDATSLRSLALNAGVRLVHEVETGSEPWRHVVTVEKITPRLVGQRLPACVDGGGAAPPDDCDGPSHYRDLLALLDRPDDPWDHELREWLPADFDPRWVDFIAINARLARLPKHRPAA